MEVRFDSRVVLTRRHVFRATLVQMSARVYYDCMKSVNSSLQVSTAFVALADSLVGKYDALDVLRTLVDNCVALLDVTAAGIVLADKFGNLQVLAATSEQSEHVELLQQRAGAGPCVDAFRSGKVITLSDIRAEGDRYPAFQAAALSQGFQSVHAIPMRIRPTTIGALNLFRNEKGVLSVEEAQIGQALADFATISLLNDRVTRDDTELNDQLQRALASRIHVEQAKGVIAQRDNVDMDEAFRRLREYSRARQQPMDVTAASVIEHGILV